MTAKHIIISLFAAAVLAAGGFGLYWIGMEHGSDMTAARPTSGATDDSQTPEAPTADPSTWGIPEGEAATRRHIRDGITAGEEDPVTGRKILYYHDPMMPGKRFEAPGKSPFMDMMLVPAYAGSEGADAGTVTISPRIVQNLGLRTAEVAEGSLKPMVTAVGAIDWNEREQAIVQARASGYVEKLHVRATLDRVRKGEPLVDLYVPEWIAVQEDFLSLRRMRGPDLAPLMDAARQRMRQAGMSDAQIRQVETHDALQTRLTISAPIDGAVTELAVRDGMTVSPGMTLMRINGFDTVWANADVPESQAVLLRPGAQVLAQTPALPGMRFEGRVQALLPQVDAATRTVTARMELDNAERVLVPGMFVQMQLRDSEVDKVLYVPSEAVIRTGRRSLVMVAEEEGRFRPVEVEIGVETEDGIEIRQGLQVGQKVVTSGQFLIDSEASLKGVEARSGEPTSVATSHRTGARVEAIDGEVLTLTHPEIPTLKWPAMTMDFRLAPDLEAPDVAVGDDVVLEFRMQEDAEPQIVELYRATSQKGNDQ